MSELVAKKIILADINNGNEYEIEDGVQPNAINSAIEGVAYAQNQSEIAVTTANEASQNANEARSTANTAKNTADGLALSIEQSNNTAQAAKQIAEEAKEIAEGAAEGSGTKVTVGGTFQQNISFDSDPQEQLDNKANVSDTTFTKTAAASISSYSWYPLFRFSRSYSAVSGIIRLAQTYEATQPSSMEIAFSNHAENIQFTVLACACTATSGNYQLRYDIDSNTVEWRNASYGSNTWTLQVAYLANNNDSITLVFNGELSSATNTRDEIIITNNSINTNGEIYSKGNHVNNLSSETGTTRDYATYAMSRGVGGNPIFKIASVSLGDTNLYLDVQGGLADNQNDYSIVLTSTNGNILRIRGFARRIASTDPLGIYYTKHSNTVDFYVALESYAKIFVTLKITGSTILEKGNNQPLASMPSGATKIEMDRYFMVNRDNLLPSTENGWTQTAANGNLPGAGIYLVYAENVTGTSQPSYYYTGIMVFNGTDPCSTYSVETGSTWIGYSLRYIPNSGFSSTSMFTASTWSNPTSVYYKRIA